MGINETEARLKFILDRYCPQENPTKKDKKKAIHKACTDAHNLIDDVANLFPSLRVKADKFYKSVADATRELRKQI